VIPGGIEEIFRKEENKLGQGRLPEPLHSFIMPYSGTPGYSSRGRTIPEEKLGSISAKQSLQYQGDVRTCLSMRLGRWRRHGEEKA